MNKSFCFLGIVMSFCTFFAEGSTKTLNSMELKEPICSEQNRPFYGEDNPLKGLLTFNVFPMIPTADQKLSRKIQDVVEKELRRIGSVSPVNLLKKDKEGKEGIDLSSFDSGVSLIYEICDMTSLDGKSTSFVRASLNVSAAVNILNTQVKSSVYVWGSNCFIKGTLSKDLEKLVLQSLLYLIQDFKTSYHSVNSTPPFFKLYGS